MQKENVFDIGSITKQFTAISILMLMERGGYQIIIIQKLMRIKFL